MPLAYICGFAPAPSPPILQLNLLKHLRIWWTGFRLKLLWRMTHPRRAGAARPLRFDRRQGVRRGLGRRAQDAQATRAARVARTAQTVEQLLQPEFEHLTVEALKLRGYHPAAPAGAQALPGRDIVLVKREQKFLARCQHWNAYKVSVDAVQDFVRTVAAQGAAGGFIVTAGRFTKEAGGLARGKPLRLIGGSACVALLQRARMARQAAMTAAPWAGLQTAQGNPRPDEPPQILLPAPAPAAPFTRPGRPPLLPWPACPVCQAAMIQRGAVLGRAGARHLWGCSAFPICKGQWQAA